MNKDMKIRYIISVFAALSLFAGCFKDIELQDTTADSKYEADKTTEYGIWKVLQIDDVNVNGVDIKPYFDWFDTFKLNLRREDGKICGISIDNGDIPHDNYGFDLPTAEVRCYFDNSVRPNVIRRSSDDQVIATFRSGVICMDFSLDCPSVSYRFMFSGAKGLAALAEE